MYHAIASGAASAPRLLAARRCFAAANARPRVAAAPMRASATAATATTTSGNSSNTPSWEIRMLYDGACPLCMKEVDFLKRRDAARGGGAIDFVDISAPGYTAADNAGITYEAAMERIHAIERDGAVITGVRVFRRLYEAVGLGWVYAATQNKAVEAAANAVYEVWAKYRTQLTGREALGVLLARRAAERAGGGGDRGSLCGEGGGACDVPQQQQQQPPAA